MKKIILAAIMLVTCTGLGAQEIKTENLGDFNKISVSGKLNVTLENTGSSSMEIVLHNTDISKLEWSIKNGVLSVRLKPTTQKDSSADVKISYKNLNEISVIGAKAGFKDVVDNGIFSASVSNGGSLRLEVATKDVTIKADGNSALMIAGETDYLDIEANMKSKADARDLTAKSATAKARNGAEIFVNGTDKLDAVSGTSSAIYYKGDPEVLKMKTRMMGVIEQYSL